MAAERIAEWGEELQFSNAIQPRLPVALPEQFGTNAAEETLRAMLQRAGLHGYRAQFRVELGPPLGSTVPDFFYADPDDPEHGICIYLDGLSEHLHGNAATATRDRQMREQLRAMGYQVIEIPFGHLSDREQMRRHFFSIGRLLLNREQARALRDEPEWFETPTAGAETAVSRDEWEETVALLDEQWHMLAHALQNAGVPAPRDVHWDIPVDSRVSGEQAVMVWDADAEPVLLVERMPERINGFRCVPAGQPVEEVALRVMEALRSR